MKTIDPIPETESERQLLTVAKSIETYRVDLGITVASLLRSYPELGTDKTYNKIVKGDLSELKVEERWLPAYQHVWSEIQNDDADDDSEMLSDMVGPVELCRAFLEVRNERGNARFVLLLGDSGVGKTSAVKIMKSKPYGGLVYDVEAVELWKSKAGRGTAVPLLRSIGDRIGMKDLPSGRDRLLNAVVNALAGKRRCLVVEELHHLCPEGINCLKTLINLTPSIIVGTAMPVLWDKLSGSRAGWAECKQLTGNRLAEVIHLKLRIEDIARYVRARLEGTEGITDEWLNKAAGRLLPDAVHYGNMNFVKAVTRRFKRDIRTGQEASLETFANAIAAEKKRR